MMTSEQLMSREKIHNGLCLEFYMYDIQPGTPLVTGCLSLLPSMGQ